VNLARTGVDEEGKLEFDEIKSIPTLMYALKGAIVDREKLDAVKRFVDEGGPELYYLTERVCTLYELILPLSLILTHSRSPKS
jgi:hypothetical protein